MKEVNVYICRLLVLLFVLLYLSYKRDKKYDSYGDVFVKNSYEWKGV